MVTRKSSLPFPTGPPPPPPPPPGAAPQDGRHVAEHDRTQSPQLTQRPESDSPYADMGNPWQEEPDSLRVQALSNTANAPTSTAQQQIPSTNLDSGIPDVLKPGWSGQVTPRSSMDSDRSKEFWESSDDEEELDKGKKTQGDKGREETSESTTSQSQLPASLQIKRKPVFPSIPREVPPSLPAFDFASNNPFRQQVSSELKDDNNVWNDDSNTHTKSEGPVTDYRPPTEQFSSLMIGKKEPTSSNHHTSQIADDTNVWDLPPQPSAAPPPIPSQAPPPAPEPLSPFSRQAPLIPVIAHSDGLAKPSTFGDDAQNRGGSPLPQQTADYNNSLIERGTQEGLISLGDELKALPNHATYAGNNAASAATSPLPSIRAEYTDGLLDRGEHNARISLGDELKALPNHAPGATSQTSLSLAPSHDAPKESLLPTNQQVLELYRAPQGPPMLSTQQQPSIDELPPAKPPRPAIVTRPLTEVELAQMQEQRNETYQIKHFQWFDHRMHKLRSSSMLTQNKNGPCPLLALVNALILGAQDQDQAVLDDFLSTREQVTLGTIIENLMEELLSSSRDGELPDVDQLNRFLLKLRTGMNMNPRLVPPAPPPPNLMDSRNSILHVSTSQQPQNAPGGFERTQDIELYSAFNVKTVHGWLAEPGTDAAAAFQRSAQNYEDAQAKLFGEDELEYKLSRNGLTPEEQVVWEDIISMKNFLSANPTQLTQYGLYCIQSSLSPGSFAILFRNDHFSTIYRHPRDGHLYTLITDAGYADRPEIIWESLVDTSGQFAEFFSGDFKSVSHGNQPSTSSPSRQRRSSPLGGSTQNEPETPLSPVQKQEQEDADLAMAIQLQEEEEQRHRQQQQQQQQQNAATRNGPGPNSPHTTRNTGRRQSGALPISLSSNRGSNNNGNSQEVRPLVPPRNARSTVQGVNRPRDPNAADAPPAYEEAARGKPYNPPLGSPLHPHSSATPESSRVDVTSVDQTQASGTMSRPSGTANNPRRRSSAYHENSQFGRSSRPSAGSTTNNNQFGSDGPSPAYDFTDGHMPGSYIHTGHGGHGQSASVSSGYPGSAAAAATSGSGRGGRDRDRDCIVM